MLIRPATKDDLPAVSAIYDHHAQSSVSTFDHETPGPDYWLPKVGASGTGEHLLVVPTTTRFAATPSRRSSGRGRRTTRRARCRSTSAWTPASRASAASCTTSCSARLRADGIHVALAVIALPNPASEALHRAFGFTQVGVLREVGWKFGAWVDTGWWQLS